MSEVPTQHRVGGAPSRRRSRSSPGRRPSTTSCVGPWTRGSRGGRDHVGLRGRLERPVLVGLRGRVDVEDPLRLALARRLPPRGLPWSGHRAPPRAGNVRAASSLVRDVASSPCAACSSTPASSRPGRSCCGWPWSRPRSARRISPASARASIAEAAGWLERGVQPDGRYTYGYDRKLDLVSSDYNITRHAGVMFGLYRLAGATEDEQALAAAEHGLTFLHANVLRHGDWSAFAEPGQDARLGASALMAIALVHRRLATGDDGEDDLLRRLARFLVAMQQAGRQPPRSAGAGRRRAPSPASTRSSAPARRSGRSRSSTSSSRARGGASRRDAWRASWRRGATTSRATCSPFRTTGPPTRSPSSALRSWASPRSPTRASSPASSVSTRAWSRRAARAESTGSCAVSRPPARAWAR